MANSKLDKMLEEVRMLTPDEQRQLRGLLDKLLATPPSKSIEDELEQRLLKAGLLSEIKPPITDFTPYQNRKPIKVKGKPLSEVIIEERR
jgi:hypothetical protein